MNPGPVVWALRRFPPHDAAALHSIMVSRDGEREATRTKGDTIRPGSMVMPRENMSPWPSPSLKYGLTPTSPPTTDNRLPTIPKDKPKGRPGSILSWCVRRIWSHRRRAMSGDFGKLRVRTRLGLTILM
jgi:hypothetical protein